MAAIPTAPAVPYVLPAESGLVMVETAADKKPAAALVVPSTDTGPTTPRRVRPPKLAAADEPLVFVETRRDQGEPRA